MTSPLMVKPWATSLWLKPDFCPCRRRERPPVNTAGDFEIAESSEDEDYYIVTLGVRPQGDFSGTSRQEQFFINKEGEVAHR